MIITIDGAAGTGKTTIAKKVAQALGCVYFDTGAMYRAFSWYLLQKKVSPQDSEKVKELLHSFAFHIRVEEDEKHYFVGEHDVTKAIRLQEVTDIVSEVSALLSVREALWKIQRFVGQEVTAVFEGRDMGTVVFPHAEKKIFLFARPEVRAKRRLLELLHKHPKETAGLDEQTVLQDLMRRDQYDSTREIAPLKKAEDAYEIETSDVSIDTAVEMILEYIGTA